MPSRTGDRTWTHGQRDSTLRNHRLDKKHDTKAGMPSREVLRDCLEDGYCWWCDTGGWKQLAVHTCKAHSITADDIRKIAGLYKHNPTCLKDETDRCSERNILGLKEGTRKRLVGPSKGYKIKFSEAGRIFQDTVRNKIIKEQRTPENLLKALNRTKEVLSKPHPCPVCGQVVPRTHPITCSPKCRKVIRQRTGAKNIRFARNPTAIDKMRNTLKRKYANGELKPPIPPKPHNCPVCGIQIPKVHPLSCSSACRHILLQKAQIKATMARRLKVPRSEYSVIVKRCLSGERAVDIAKDYGISRKYVQIIASRRYRC